MFGVNSLESKISNDKEGNKDDENKLKNDKVKNV